jgi:hypothetical protein
MVSSASPMVHCISLSMYGQRSLYAIDLDKMGIPAPCIPYSQDARVPNHHKFLATKHWKNNILRKVTINLDQEKEILPSMSPIGTVSAYRDPQRPLSGDVCARAGTRPHYSSGNVLGWRRRIGHCQCNGSSEQSDCYSLWHLSREAARAWLRRLCRGWRRC